MNNLNVEKIDNILNKFLEEFGATAKLDEEFRCQAKVNRVIHYALYVQDYEQEWFDESVARVDSDIVCDPFLSSFFHELGHLMTAYNFTEEDWDNYFDDVVDIEDEVYTDMPLEKLKELNFRYFNLPIERAATEWACKYMRENVNKVSKLWEELKPAILECYFNLGLSSIDF